MTATHTLTRYMWLSIAAAVVTIGLKVGAYTLTGSVGLLSDAMESGVNFLAAVAALFLLTRAMRPDDALHPFGHGKIEYFSSGFEGALILVAAGGIAWTAIQRLLAPQPIEQVGLGLIISVLASAVNFGVSRIILAAGRLHNSITLEADAHHLMTDVWTSVGVVIGVGLVAFTGWHILDPIVALLVAANIVWTGVQLMRRSVLGLIDTAIPPAEQAAIERVLAQYRRQGIEFHAIRTRQAGSRSFLSLHVLVPGDWTVQQGHQTAEQVEVDIHAAVPTVFAITHLEPLTEPEHAPGSLFG